MVNLTSLAIVTISVREVRDYVPAASPTFAALIARRFQSSIGQLTAVLKGVILMLMSIIPWLPVWAVALGLLWLVRRWVRPRFRPRSLLTPGETENSLTWLRGVLGVPPKVAAPRPERPLEVEYRDDPPRSRTRSDGLIR